MKFTNTLMTCLLGFTLLAIAGQAVAQSDERPDDSNSVIKEFVLSSCYMDSPLDPNRTTFSMDNHGARYAYYTHTYVQVEKVLVVAIPANGNAIQTTVERRSNQEGQFQYNSNYSDQSTYTNEYVRKGVEANVSRYLLTRVPFRCK